MNDVARNNLRRIGVLGCGQISQAAHFEAIQKARNTELYAICDLAEDLVAEMAGRYHPARTFTDYDSMLGDPAIDAVVVAVADQFHVKSTLEALDAGKHVLVEKPLGVNVEECERVVAAARCTGLTVQVGSMKRFDPGIQFARSFVARDMGEMLALKAWYCDSTYRYAMTDTLQPVIVTSEESRRPSGNPKSDRKRYFLLGHGSHLVDTARFLGGDIVSVQARLVEKFDAFSWFIDAEFANGANGHLDLTIPVRMDWHEGFEIYGAFGSVVGKTYNPWYLRSSDVSCFSSRDGQYHQVLGEDSDFYRRQLEAFADAIGTSEGTGAATAEDGLEALKILVAISRSTQKGERVAVADVTGGP